MIIVRRAQYGFALALLLAVLAPANAGLPRDSFFVYGDDIRDSLVPLSDDGFIQVQLQYGFQFFNQTYQSLFLNVNGAITFGQGVSDYTPVCGSLSTPMIAPYWADVDIRFGGKISYRESVFSFDLQPATQIVTAAFPEYQGLNLGWAFIATWIDVPFYGENDQCLLNNSITNTFQVMLTSDGANSFVIFNYNTTAWTTGTASNGTCAGTGGIPAKAGFDVGDNSTFYQIAFSCTPGISNIGDGTNAMVPGRYIFKVDSGYSPSACASFSQHTSLLRITSSFVPVNGHVPITLQGPCLSGVTNLKCTFIHPFTSAFIPVPAVQVGDTNSATCIVPYIDSYARLLVLLSMDRNGVTEQYTGLYYTIEPTYGVFPYFYSTSGNASVFFGWDYTAFGDASTKLDVVLLENVNLSWVERGIVASQISNSYGAFSGTLSIGTPNATNPYSLRLTKSPAVLSDVQTVPGFQPSLFSVPFYLGSTDAATSIAACQTWFQNDNGPPTGLMACPPTLDQVLHDPRFTTDWTLSALAFFRPGAEYSFRQRSVRVYGAGLVAGTAPAQQCNYANGTLIIGPYAGGSATVIAPLTVAEAAHFKADVIPWYQCCRYSADDASCRNYYVKRPSDPGTSYVAPPIATSFGDPHMVTFDKASYTFNAVGEFWMVKSNNFSMQARMARFFNENGTLTNASVFTSFVMQQAASDTQNKTTVQVTVNPAGLNLYIDGAALTVDSNQQFPIRTLINGVSVNIEEPNKMSFDFTYGLTLVFSTAGDNTAINVIGMADKSLYGQVNGLFGFFDGNPSNDLKAPDGTTISTTSSLETIHYQFGLKWQITSAESLFTYTPGKKYSDYQDASFVPSFASVDPATLPPNAQAVCGNSAACAYDYSITGDLGFAPDTAASETTFNESRTSLTTVVPTCNPLSNPTNGYFTANNFLVGSTATFTCNRGYEMVGSKQLTCTKTGSNPPAWNHNSPTCKQCCLDCSVCIVWASIWRLLHFLPPPPLSIPPCCPVSYY